MSKLLVAWHHFKTITMHRILVMQGCFKMGLYWQGLTHDLSKYSPTEFKTGVQYYQGDKSPNAAEREAKGYSESWLHHFWSVRNIFRAIAALIMQRRKRRDIPPPGCIIRAETVIIMNIGRM